MTRSGVGRVARWWPVPATILGFMVVVALVGVPLVMGEPKEEGLPDLAKFLGRFHPVVLHLPIGVLIWVVVQEVLGFRAKGREGPSSRTALGFAALSAVVACVFGFLLYHSMPDYDRELVERHLWGGIVFASLAVAAYVAKVWTDAAGFWSAVYRFLLFLGVGVMFITSHDGASLTHGKGYLTEYAPLPVRSALGLPLKKDKGERTLEEPVAAADPVVYTSLIAPVLESKCYQCHNADKQKGKYRMDQYDLLLKGGTEGDGIVPGDPEGSLVLTRIRLPEDDEEHMPPEGKKDLEEHEIVLLDWWVAEGASEKARLSEMRVSEAVKAALVKAGAPGYAEGGAGTGDVPPKAVFDPELDGRVAALRKEFSVALNYEYRGSGNLVFTAAGLRAKFDDADLAKLGPVLPVMVSLDLSGTSVTAEGLKALAGAASLRDLRLAETEIGDEAMETVAGLSSLESLNLFGTKVTGVGVSKLVSLPNLRSLFLWHTGVGEKDIEELREKLPGCRIVTGI